MWRFVADRVKTGRSWLNDRLLTRANEGNWPNPAHDNGPESTRYGQSALSITDGRRQQIFHSATDIPTIWLVLRCRYNDAAVGGWTPRKGHQRVMLTAPRDLGTDCVKARRSPCLATQSDVSFGWEVAVARLLRLRHLVGVNLQEADRALHQARRILAHPQGYQPEEWTLLATLVGEADLAIRLEPVVSPSLKALLEEVVGDFREATNGFTDPSFLDATGAARRRNKELFCSAA